MKPSRLAREIAEMTDAQRRLLWIKGEAVRDETVEHWLRTEGVAAYDELKADPSRGRTPGQVRQRLADERGRREAEHDR
ncbi:type II toxin-antitoxin system ParD family antitoxin [Chelatococcus asaccharovorans]|nr:type II toxin-antitoxin system ParD family antitoxin [Chelatococcus asaccharovorans]MBS7708150.1 type II toxin-antitoxin system ParD family antitoxin [Chelatococcus asaccharovorans]